MAIFDYPVTIQRLSAADGGGYAAYVPDLPGCISDGETPDDAYQNVQGAIVEWMATAERAGMMVPRPSYNERSDADRRLGQDLIGTVSGETVQLTDAGEEAVMAEPRSEPTVAASSISVFHTRLRSS